MTDDYAQDNAGKTTLLYRLKVPFPLCARKMHTQLQRRPTFQIGSNERTGDQFAGLKREANSSVRSAR